MWIDTSFWHSLNWLSLQHRKPNLAISYLSSSCAIDSTLFTISYCTFTTTTCKSTLRSMYKRSTLHVPPLSLVACLMLDVTRMLSRICWCQSPATFLLISFARKSRSETVSSSCCLGSKSVSTMVALTRMFTMPWPRFTLIQTTILSLSWRRTKWVVQGPRCVATPFNPLHNLLNTFPTLVVLWSSLHWKVLREERSLPRLYLLPKGTMWLWTYQHHKWELHVQAPSTLFGS